MYTTQQEWTIALLKLLGDMNAPDYAAIRFDYWMGVFRKRWWSLGKRRAKDSIAHAKTRQARNTDDTDLRRCDVNFNIGDQVLQLLSTSNLKSISAAGLQARWSGPVSIKAILNPVAVQLDLPWTFRMHNSLHVSQIRPYRTSSHGQFPDHENHVHQPPPVQPETDTDQPEYEVEKIIGHRKVAKGKAAGRPAVPRKMGRSPNVWMHIGAAPASQKFQHIAQELLVVPADARPGRFCRVLDSISPAELILMAKQSLNIFTKLTLWNQV